MIRGIKNKIKFIYNKLQKQLYKDENIFLVYSMGKVGSSTVYTALRNQRPYAEIFHVHFLSNNWLNNILPNLHKNFHGNIKLGNDILANIKKNPNKKIKIITLVREPISRAISDLFQNWDHLFSDIEKVSNEELITHIKSVNHDYTLNWFDTEFFEFLNIDIYSLPFDTNKGYEIYNHNNIDILCIKLEMLNNVCSRAFNDFIGSNLDLATSNSSVTKKGSDKYKHLKSNVKFIEERLSELYNSKYVRHFYSVNEINSFIKKWSITTTEDSRP